MANPKIYNDFYNKKVFTFDEVKQKYRKVNTTSSLSLLIHNAKSNNYIGYIKRGLYYIIPQGFSKKDYVVNKYIIANKLSPAGILAYHSALELHGVAQSTFNRVFVISKQKFSKLEFQGTTFVHLNGNTCFGRTTFRSEGVSVQCTDRERTIIDGINRIKYVGGLEEHLKSIRSFPSVDFQSIKNYLEKYKKIKLYSKVGFLLTLFKNKWSFPETVRGKLKSKIRKKVYYLTNKRENGKLNKEWNLIVPENFSGIMNGV